MARRVHYFNHQYALNKCLHMPRTSQVSKRSCWSSRRYVPISLLRRTAFRWVSSAGVSSLLAFLSCLLYLAIWHLDRPTAIQTAIIVIAAHTLALVDAYNNQAQCRHNSAAQKLRSVTHACPTSAARVVHKCNYVICSLSRC